MYPLKQTTKAKNIMTNLQKIKSVAKEAGLLFIRQKATSGGAWLYNFEDEFGIAVASNWTIASAINEHKCGDLLAKIS
jgi:hypothetical protein